MNRDWLLIPEFEYRWESKNLADQYGAAFEYNDFFSPEVYENEAETERRINGYLELGRDTKKDTLHGVFLDIVATSTDTTIREYSKKRMLQSLAIAKRLGVKGVVFHSGLVPGVEQEGYLSLWLNGLSEFLHTACLQYPDLEVYIENTLEKSPKNLLRLAEQMKDVKNFGLCLDYAHAAISGMDVSDWVAQMGPYLRHFHINDNDTVRDLHQIPGDGRIDWKQFKDNTQSFRNISTLIEINGVEQQNRALRYLTTL